MRAIIIEDEKPARDLMKSFLKDYPEVELVAECEDGFSGIKSIQEHKPDLVFLDIQMPKLTGFELLEVLDDIPNIIFATAYDEYAIKAFEYNAIDYLLKPFSKKRFGEAIKKAVERTSDKKAHKEKVNNLLKDVNEKIEELTRIVIKDRNKINVVPVDKIKYFEAEDDYVMIFTTEGKYLKKGTMKYYETHLNSDKFVRIHRSFIANVDFIKKMELFEKDSHILILKDDSRLKISKSGYKLLKEILKF